LLNETLRSFLNDSNIESDLGNMSYREDSSRKHMTITEQLQEENDEEDKDEFTSRKHHTPQK